MIDRLDDLIAAARDGSDDSAYAELSDLIRIDPAARRRYLVQVAIWSELSAGLIAPTASSTPQKVAATTDRRDPSGYRDRSTFRLTRYALTGIAAAALLAAAVVAIYLFAVGGQPETPHLTPDTPSVATVIDTSDGATLVVNNQIAAAGSEIRSGEVSLDAGSAEFRLTSGVHIRLRGETRLTVHDPMNATLAIGSATFDCANVPPGYTVNLNDGARIVDMGTVFQVAANPGEPTRVSVTSGRVAVFRPGSTESTEVSAGEYAVLRDDSIERSVEPTLVQHRVIAQPTDIANDGRLIKAVNLLDRQNIKYWNVALPVTVNGIDFAVTDESVGPEWQASEHRSDRPDFTPDQQRLANPLRELLTSIGFVGSASGEITFAGLRPGATYRVQLIHYERPGKQRTQRITIGDGEPIDYAVANSATDPVGDGLIYRWRATGDRLTIRYERIAGDPAILSAIVLHEIDASPDNTNPSGESNSP